MYVFGPDSWRDFQRGTEKEWLVANGLGGYAAGTLIGANTRKYHGVLVAAHDPPAGRTLHLAKVDERLECGGVTYNTAANWTVTGPADGGFVHLVRVHFDPFPTFIYSLPEIVLEKTIFTVYGQNTAVVLYRVTNSSGEKCVLRLTPLVNCRGYHYVTKKNEINFEQRVFPKGVALRGREGLPELYLTCCKASYHPLNCWYEGMFYACEEERGEEPREDHYMPGFFQAEVQPQSSALYALAASTEGPFETDNWEELLAKEERRLRGLLARVDTDDPLLRRLALAADAFLVRRRSTASTTVVAGYPWFNDWGRDAMISLPGLTLVTGRFEEARQILCAFARLCQKGLLPNAFWGDLREPLYNSVDASLWFFYAAYKYLEYTADIDFISCKVYPVLKEIAGFYAEGTDYGIAAGEDGFLRAGYPRVQLTWMDAKVGDWVVTPRHGQPVEVNALWCHALAFLEKLSKWHGEKFNQNVHLQKVRENFLEKFWCQKGYLYDVITEGGADDSLRPNQLLAVSLPFAPVRGRAAREVVRAVWRELYTPYGIRSLSPRHPAYRGTYTGDQLARDGAYHQGTAWSWLMGPFVAAIRRAFDYNRQSRQVAAQVLRPFAGHLSEAGVGYISEIFDGDWPHRPRGCLAQAWGVAEVLRAYSEDVLEVRPPAEKRVETLLAR